MGIETWSAPASRLRLWRLILSLHNVNYRLNIRVRESAISPAAKKIQAWLPTLEAADSPFTFSMSMLRDPGSNCLSSLTMEPSGEIWAVNPVVLTTTKDFPSSAALDLVI